MKIFYKVVIAVFAILLSTQIMVCAGTNSSLKLTNIEQSWLNNHRNHTFILGVDPYSGIEYFNYNNKPTGYIFSLIDLFKKDLGLNIQLEASKPWGQVFSGLKKNTVDILFGANETSDRDKFMSFTTAVTKNPYAIITQKGSSINTIGDIDTRKVGFINDDIVIQLLPKIYKNISYEKHIYSSQQEAVDALLGGELDAFITSGGLTVYDFIYHHPQLKYAFKINTITSDMTFSTRKSDSILAGILNKEIQNIGPSKLKSLINNAEVSYNIKIMNLTKAELSWLKKDGKAIVGITKDYLPFDYYYKNEYKGISGEIIKEISRKTGIKFINYYSDFDTLSNKLKAGQIDILNIAKTKDRMKYILYPSPYSLERDIIIGRRDKPDARDIFGLEGKRVAVIKGFWHYELLKKNLTNVDIISTSNIEESMKLVHDGRADYLIENPTVARFYIAESGYYDLVERGTTSTDSYLYYGINMKKPELAGIINKVLPLMDIEELFRIGYEEVPHTDNNTSTKNLIFTILGLFTVLIMIIIWLIKLFKDLVKEKTTSALLREREHYLYTDALTDLKNRNYFHTKLKPQLDNMELPVGIIVCDINNLKIINDSLGHHSGDLLLALFGDILKASAPHGSHIFRMGGDEFLIIIENTNDSLVQSFIDQLQRNCRTRYTFSDSNIKIRADAAIGYAIRNSSDEDFDELMKIADTNMYKNKKQKKNLDLFL